MARKPKIRAYRRCCAVCRLRHDELLEAAHILPDGHPLEEPVIPNGLALCKRITPSSTATSSGSRPISR